MQCPPRACEKLLSCFTEQVSTFCDEFCNCCFTVGVRTFTREAQQIGERQPAPWDSQYGKPCDPIGRVKQCASKSECIEYFGPFVERVDLDRAERNGTGAIISRQFRGDRSEVFARAGEYRDAPRPGATGRERSCTPFLDNAADLATLALNPRGAKRGCCQLGIARNRMTVEDFGM